MLFPGPLLFVYGTLRPGAGHAPAEFLSAHARSLGPARCPGRLYDLGPYPGMVGPCGEGEWVHGEVYELEQPEKVLPVLDRYEGCDVAGGPNGLYERRLVMVNLNSGTTHTAWAYYYRGTVAEEQRIISGDYLETVSKRGLT
jgi:gamma-glutamylcyclotransferase (GGCT)/AIG2-like uncharacterized protein YtfP